MQHPSAGPMPLRFTPRPHRRIEVGDKSPHSKAFTLVELLVVIAVIAVLLAMLLPAMDQAIYRAELVLCSSRLKGIANGMTVYAVDQQRFFPYNKHTATNLTWHAPLIKLVNATNNNDLRSTLSPYMPLQDILFDPMIKPQDIETNSIEQMYGNYSLWNFWKWTPAVDPTSRGQRKIGDRFTYQDARFTFRQHAWDILAGDFMRAMNTDTDPGAYWTNHPGKQDGSFLHRTANGAANQFTFWISQSPKRDPVDYNVVRQDGAVQTLSDVSWDDERLAHPPEFNSAVSNSSGSFFHQLPVD